MIPHILIIDPDEAAARVTRALLTRVVPAAAVVVEPTVERGRRRVQERPPDILLLDVSANQLADERLIREVRALNPHTRVIALAGGETRAARRLLATQQIDGYLEKASAPETLVRALRELLAQQSIALTMSCAPSTRV